MCLKCVWNFGARRIVMERSVKRPKLSPVNHSLTSLKSSKTHEISLDDSLDTFFPSCDLLDDFAPQTQVSPSNLHATLCTDLIVCSKTESTLICRKPNSLEQFYVYLEGFWRDTIIMLEDKIKVFGVWKPDNSIVISDTNNLLITNPDTLISCTVVSSATFCSRKTVLNERIRGGGIGESSIHLLLGNLVHQLFQNMCSFVGSKEFCSKDLKSVLMKELMMMVAEEKVLDTLYSLKISKTQVLKEVDPYLNPILTWLQNYLIDGKPLKFENDSSGDSSLTVSKIRDIEENIHCPQLGLKGKIDLSLQVNQSSKVKVHSRSKVIPLELKTGKVSNSIEHQGQVSLYTVMLSTLLDNSDNGILLYLKGGEAFAVKLNDHALRGVIQMRNDLSTYFRPPNTYADNEIALDRYYSLPTPIDHPRACLSCHLNTACAMFYKNSTCGSKSSSFETVAEQVLQHLSMEEVQFYLQWVKWIYMEYISSNNRQKTNGSPDTIPDVSITCVDGNVVTFCLPKENDYSKCLTKGTSVIVSDRTSNHTALFIGSIVNCSDNSVVIRVDRSPPCRIKGHRFDIVKCESGGTTQLSMAYITRVMQDHDKGAQLRKLVIKLDKPSFVDRVSASDLKVIKSTLVGLNVHQMRAVVRTIRAQDYVLIRGMPGCGKTQTVVMLVLSLVKLGKSVLISAYTHSALDNLISKLKMVSDCPRIIRLGRKGQICEHNWDLTVTNHLSRMKGDAMQAMTELYEQTSIIACTCLQMGQHTLTTSRVFDYAIVDEACLCLLPPLMGPLLQASKFVLVGDTKQLKPLVQNRDARNDGMQKSLFQILAESHPDAVVTLAMQYRMNRCIMNVANQFAYENKLECANASVGDGCIPVYNSPTDWAQYLRLALSSGMDKSVVLVNTGLVESGQFTCKTEGKGLLANYGEAKLVAQIVQKMIQAGVESAEIGVICVYRHQIGVVLTEIHAILDSISADSIFVSTGDQYQGKDKQVIIVSLCWTPSDTPGGPELLKEEERITVIVTRAKHKLVIVGHLSSLVTHSDVIKRLVYAVNPICYVNV